MMILPTITTITPEFWRSKIAEVRKLKLKEICLFLTCLNAKQRQELRSLLKETSVESIPFIHIRSDVVKEELEYFMENYGTQFFNTHSLREFPLVYDYGDRRKNIYIENNQYPFDEKEITEFGGTCLDLSHLENDRLLYPDNYQINARVLAKYPPKCSHISVIKKEAFSERGFPKITTHLMEDLSELDYLKRYPLEYFGSVAALELENSIEEQLKAQEYISILLTKKGSLC